jgi:hypothetical protein
MISARHIISIHKIRSIAVAKNSRATSAIFVNIFSNRETQSRRFFSSDATDDSTQKKSLIDKYFGYDTCEASPTFKNRWMMAIPGCATHMCLG